MSRENSILSVIRSRRSVRRFSSEPVPRQTLEMLIEMATCAPSPFNNQPWRFIVITRRALIRQIAGFVEQHSSAISESVARASRGEYEAYRRNAVFFRDAPALVIVLLKPMNSDAKGHLWGVPGFFEHERKARGDIQSIGAACQNLMLAAASEGIGSCLMLYPLVAGSEIRALLSIEPPWEISACIPLGYPAGEASAAPKRRLPARIAEYIEEDE